MVIGVTDFEELSRVRTLITVDHYIDFYELDQLFNTQSSTVINQTKAHFAHHGVSVPCFTYNGPQFNTHEYKYFANRCGVEHITTSPNLS